MRNLFGLIVALAVFMISSVSYARINGNDPAVLADMYKNPMHYVHIGADNFGMTYYLDRTSVNVQEYAPPNYIIACTKVYHHRTYVGNADEEQAGYTSERVNRYKYDYASRKMYVERYDSVGNPYWEYLAPLTDEQQRTMSGGAARGYERAVAQGEIAFFVAYRISFYERPTTEVAKQFITHGRSCMMPLIKLNLSDTNDGTTHTSHEYNHKTNQIEVWQYTYNKATRKFDSKRIG